MKKTRHKAARIGLSLCLCASSMLAGCWDRREINDLAFSMVTSFDTAPKGRYKESVLVALPGQMGGPTGGGGGTTGQFPFYIDSAVAENIRLATSDIQRRMSRQLNFSHRRVLIVGEDLAKKGIRPIFDVTARPPQNRLSAFLVIAKGKGEELLAATPHLERFSGEAIREILLLTPTGRANLKEIGTKLSLDGIDPVIPLFEAVPTKGQGPEREVQSVGVALFSDDRMVGTVTGDEVSALLWLVERFQPYMEKVMVNKRVISIGVESGEVNLSLVKSGPPLEFRVAVKAEGGVLEDTSPVDLFEEDNLRRVEKAWEQQLTQRIDRIIKKLQRVNSDAFGAGLELYRTFPAEWMKRKDQWRKEFTESKFIVDVDCRLRRVGQTSGNVAGKREAME